ncbi:hypothetical protein LP419_05870 [Massilia sp. H-1]|nr:hypothetical protein LP419_05870 [Massilia sp. H-1]
MIRALPPPARCARLRYRRGNQNLGLGQESGHGIERSLYVREGSRIRPVLQRMVTSRWEYINGYQPYLNTQESPRPATEDFTYKISIAPSAHHGFADLRITRKSSVAGHPKVTELLHYDGKQYPNPARVRRTLDRGSLLRHDSCQ